MFNNFTKKYIFLVKNAIGITGNARPSKQFYLLQMRKI